MIGSCYYMVNFPSGWVEMALSQLFNKWNRGGHHFSKVKEGLTKSGDYEDPTISVHRFDSENEPSLTGSAVAKMEIPELNDEDPNCLLKNQSQLPLDGKLTSDLNFVGLEPSTIPKSDVPVPDDVSTTQATHIRRAKRKKGVLIMLGQGRQESNHLTGDTERTLSDMIIKHHHDHYRSTTGEAMSLTSSNIRNCNDRNKQLSNSTIVASILDLGRRMGVTIEGGEEKSLALLTA
ncbi:hypothetical protein VNO77_04371 [Canavalia gladiata]|uniref:Uncharacterized protein n=1 Tax=Canavalia gladiata TaxID=3824 RepID=A0AAN9MYF9_CANGL